MKIDFAGIRERNEDTLEKHECHFTVQNGQFVMNCPGKNPERFDFVRGRIVKIETRAYISTYGATNANAIFTFEFEGRSCFDLTIPLYSSVGAQFLSRLAKLKTPADSVLRIDAYLINKYTNFRVRENGRRVVFVEMPRIHIRDENGERIDTTRRDAEINKIMSDLKSKLETREVDRYFLANR